MKEAIGHIFRVVAAIFLIILAAVLFVVITPIALVHQIYVSIARENRKARDILTGMKLFFTSLAASIDQFGNTAFAALFNDLFLKTSTLDDHGKTVYLFGNKDETISEVLGWNERFFTYRLTRIGKALIWLLNALDKDHCYNAYVSGKNAAKEKVAILEYLTSSSNSAFAKARQTAKK
jgi:hypothetical protein